MNKKSNLEGKKVSVIGLSRSGLAAARLLSTKGACVYISEAWDNTDIQDNIKKLDNLKNIHIEIGRHSEDFIKGSEFLVVSPGVKQVAIPIIFALKSGIPIISEIELGYLFCPAKIIAVTGTNGKTTVTTLIGNILQRQGLRTFILGNIGKAFCEDVLSLAESDFVVLEVSTFQLEWINKFKPYVSVILNISRNHLDRHKDMSDYIALKKRIFSNQTKDDFTVLNENDLLVREFARETKAQVVYFGNQDSINANQQAAVAVASIFGIKLDTCLSVFKDFKGIEHRLEYVDTVQGVDFINDSKSTTLDATVWALKNIKNPIILIAGGQDKGADFSLLRPYLEPHLKNIILIGEAKNLIRSSLENTVSLYDKDTLEEATEAAFNLSSEGDCVLLSPMCASFDMFCNFEERGRVFKEAVRKIKKANA